MLDPSIEWLNYVMSHIHRAFFSFFFKLKFIFIFYFLFFNSWLLVFRDKQLMPYYYPFICFFWGEGEGDKMIYFHYIRLSLSERNGSNVFRGTPLVGLLTSKKTPLFTNLATTWQRRMRRLRNQSSFGWTKKAQMQM